MIILFELKVTEHFDAAHYLRDYPGKCRNIHGHTWQVEVLVRGEILNEIGLVMDFSELKKIIKNILELFDHRLINDIPPFDKLNPSSENLARWFYQKLKESLADRTNVVPVRVSVSESQSTAAIYYEDK